MGSGSICYCFSLNVRSAAAQFAVKGHYVILKDSPSLNQTRCHHPLITQLSLVCASLQCAEFLILDL